MKKKDNISLSFWSSKFSRDKIIDYREL